MLRLLAGLLVAGCLAVPAARLWPADAPEILIIRRGGTYTGSFRSTDSDVPCVRILTTEPVVLDSCTFEGAGHLVESTQPGAQLTLRNCQGRGLPPTKDQTPPGRFLTVSEARAVRVENCRLEQTSGIYVYKWRGNGSPAQTLKIIGNRALNIDGRYRDGGVLTVSFVGLNQVRGVANMEIAWNEVVNQPDQSKVEDNINIYNSGGTAASPLRVHDNYVQGAYPFPATGPKFSGTGMTTDGDGSTAQTTTAYVEAYDNQFVSTCNAAMNIAAGHHVYYHHNRMVTSGMLPDGRRLAATYAATSVFNAYKKPQTVFFNHRTEQNVIGYAKPGYQIPYPDRHDLSHNNCAPCTGTEHLPNPITLESERQEWLRWQQKLNGYRAGQASGARRTD